MNHSDAESFHLMTSSWCLNQTSWWCHQMEIFRVTGSFPGESTGHHWIPLTKASDVELWCFFFICAKTNSWANNEALRRHCALHDVSVMLKYSTYVYLYIYIVLHLVVFQWIIWTTHIISMNYYSMTIHVHTVNSCIKGERSNQYISFEHIIKYIMPSLEKALKPNFKSDARKWKSFNSGNKGSSMARLFSRYGARGCTLIRGFSTTTLWTRYNSPNIDYTCHESTGYRWILRAKV